MWIKNLALALVLCGNVVGNVMIEDAVVKKIMSTKAGDLEVLKHVKVSVIKFQITDESTESKEIVKKIKDGQDIVVAIKRNIENTIGYYRNGYDYLKSHISFFRKTIKHDLHLTGKLEIAQKKVGLINVGDIQLVEPNFTSKKGKLNFSFEYLPQKPTQSKLFKKLYN